MRASGRAAIACARAIRNSGFEFPHHRITVNLAPADVRKAGSSFDLPIALGLLAASGHARRGAHVDDTVVARRAVARRRRSTAIRGVLPDRRRRAPRSACKRLLLPPQNAAEACVVEGLEVCPVARCAEAVEALNRPDDARSCASAVRPRPCRHAGQRRRPCRRARPAAGAPRARDRGGRRPQPAADRPARRRQDDDGAAAAGRSCRR